MAEERESTGKTSMKILALRAYWQATPPGRVRPLSKNGGTNEILLENDCRSPPVKFDLLVPQASGSSLNAHQEKWGQRRPDSDRREHLPSGKSQPRSRITQNRLENPRYRRSRGTPRPQTHHPPFPHQKNGD